MDAPHYTEAPAGLHFHDLRAWMDWRSPGRTLTETELSLFTMLTGDRHPIHADAASASASPFGQRVFQGSYGIALTIAMCTPFPGVVEPVVAATGLDEWRFEQPLFIGDSVHARAELLSARVTRDGRRGLIERRLSLHRHDGTLLQQGRAGLLVQLG